MTSFAKYYIVGEATGNINPNRFYVLHNRGSKLEAYPFWDAEWSFGLGRLSPTNGWYRWPSDPMPVDEPFYDSYSYFKYLIKSPLFRHEVKCEWLKNKNKIEEVKKTMAELRTKLNYAETDNFKKWDVLGKYLDESLIAFSSWEEEVNYIENWFNSRLIWFDNYINSWE